MRDDLTIPGQSLAVVRVHLAKPAIEKAPSFFGRTIDEAQVVGREQHNRYQPYQIGSFFRDAIDLDPFALTIIKGKEFDSSVACSVCFWRSWVDDHNLNFRLIIVSLN